jgi:serine/threonine protein kinase
MANVQASMISHRNSELSSFALETMSGWGTLPYMSPERFSKYRTNKAADIFSLGVVFFEIICGRMPYDLRRPLPEQVISGESYWSAAAALKFCPNNISNLVLAMIHPDEDKRLYEYSLIIKAINSL